MTPLFFFFLRQSRAEQLWQQVTWEAGDLQFVVVVGTLGCPEYVNVI